MKRAILKEICALGRTPFCMSSDNETNYKMNSLSLVFLCVALNWVVHLPKFQHETLYLENAKQLLSLWIPLCTFCNTITYIFSNSVSGRNFFIWSCSIKFYLEAQYTPFHQVGKLLWQHPPQNHSKTLEYSINSLLFFGFLLGIEAGTRELW